MESLDRWIERQYRHALAAMLPSLSPVGITKTRPGFGQTVHPRTGSIVASPVLAAYDPDPDRIGPPELFVWTRFRDAPGHDYLHAALLTQSTTHWTVAAALRPHAGFGESMAHRSISTGITMATITFHDDADISDWLLYATRITYAGRGHAQSEGQIFTRDGNLIATYGVHAMLRAFPPRGSSTGELL